MKNEMGKTELIIQLSKLVFGAYFVWWSWAVLKALNN